jgi:hypothetical protein
LDGGAYGVTRLYPRKAIIAFVARRGSKSKEETTPQFFL